MKTKLLKIDELFNMKAKKLALKYNVSIKHIYNLRSKNRDNPRAKFINTDLFNLMKDMNTQEKAYIIGLLVADGTVNNSSIILTLNKRDKEILEKIHNYLNINNPIIDKCYKNKSPISRLSIYSTKLSKHLSKYSLIKNKTYNSFFPNINKELYSHFIRGYFDGDGCIHIDKGKNLHIKIVGNRKLIEKMQNIIVDSCNISNTKVVHCNNAHENIVALQHGGNIKCIKILDYIYKDANLYMSRKYKIYKKFKNEYRY